MFILGTDASLLETSVKLSRELGITIYDSCYLALAQKVACPLVTASLCLQKQVPGCNIIPVERWRLEQPMTIKKDIAKEYQQALIDAYYDYIMSETLGPLYEAFKQWKMGNLEHDEITELIPEIHTENRQAYNFFMQSRKWLISCIKADTEWFSKWLSASSRSGPIISKIMHVKSILSLSK